MTPFTCTLPFDLINLVKKGDGTVSNMVLVSAAVTSDEAEAS